jgi:hypothetical protein
MQRNGSGTLSTQGTSPQVTLTSEASLTLAPTISAVIPKPTSSPESADGPSRSGLPDGTTIDLFGQVRVHVSPLALAGSVKGLTTPDNVGPNGSASSASAALQRSLESRLRALPFGSTECVLTWRPKATPLRRPYCQLVPSMPLTDEIASGLWPTPNVAMATGGQTSRSGARKGELLIGGLARSLAPQLWPTPTAITDSGGAALCKWGGTRSRVNGALDPAFPCWLMGYKPEHLSCAPTETQSSRKSPRRSSVRL